MAFETELKLRIAPEYLARLKRHPFLRSLSSGRAVTRTLYSIYFDTHDLRLHHAAMALRLRRVGQQWLQTLKGGGGVQAGLHQRNEWETPVDAEQLDFAALEVVGANPFAHDLRKKLQPLFVTDFTRSIRMVQFEGALIELSLDSGEVRAGKFVHPISEVELELKSGEPLQLYRLAIALLDIVPLEIESISKAEYGYRLHVPVADAVVKAPTLKLERNTSLADALKKMIWSCLTQLQANFSGALQAKDIEYLHQMRIALRRLRLVLNMAEKYRADTELDSLRECVVALAGVLGEVRDWDVFISETIPFIQERLGDGVETRLILQQSQVLRLQLQHRLHAAFARGDFQRLLLRFGAWMSGQYWHANGLGDDLKTFSSEMLRKHNKKVRQLSEQLHPEPDALELHKLRIACKKFRYCIEFFSSLYAPESSRHTLKSLAELQEFLGKLNDAVVALRLLEEIEPSSTPSKLLRHARHAVVSQNAQHQRQLQKAWKQFAARPKSLLLTD